MKQLKTNSELGGAVTLEECFDLYTRAEILGAEDAWHCPYCNKKQEVVKKLGLWSLPDILVIHLKRFRQQSKQRSTSKLTMLVDFPLYGFDMTPHLAHNGVQTHNNVGSLGGLGWSPWKKPRPVNRIFQSTTRTFTISTRFAIIMVKIYRAVITPLSVETLMTLSGTVSTILEWKQ